MIAEKKTRAEGRILRDGDRVFIDRCASCEEHMGAPADPATGRRTCRVHVEDLLPEAPAGASGRWEAVVRFIPDGAEDDESSLRRLADAAWADWRRWSERLRAVQERFVRRIQDQAAERAEAIRRGKAP